MRTIWWDAESRAVGMIDQTHLPERLEDILVGSIDGLCEAIQSLRVRGAPALGAAGAYGVALAAARSGATDPAALLDDVREAAGVIRAARPTAVNLSWGVDRAVKAIDEIKESADADEIRAAALAEAELIAGEDVSINKALGEVGASLLEDGDVVLTHCNAGRLACVDWGTALGVIRSAVAQGKKISVYACETRPLFQGSRLTAWELSEDNIPVTLICDSMAGMIMRQGKIDKVIVGADRITKDAVFNKIGTYTHAVLAKAHGIPFYVAAPISTFDLAHSEEEVEIEERGADEIRRLGDRQLAPPEVRVYNPAFDATPIDLVTGIITERGIYRPPEIPFKNR
ncbi:S-methyl-5-thioribose-1-phosphate isomerase [Methanotrichaceae archaeon M04Ac]|uniref:Putative methylthioribose-1-phosphate isomerase n=1 Tax=Candidatus Methanocrinis alkalitolerans TaxID=3033395 RepID=A0ABT5XHX1_9EURY|nr:S-methyl-5-thioribose-1-phosphate isomerase [Candidatus Methanocrinis alkalitolerans]MDF0594319.1 S-methyl-5-thioribose-1-phosphate isomerase [Candidatus Methanocrinis alkalitolerans]